jgi:hypothetical protein
MARAYRGLATLNASVALAQVQLFADSLPALAGPVGLAIRVQPRATLAAWSVYVRRWFISLSAVFGGSGVTEPDNQGN